MKEDDRPATHPKQAACWVRRGRLGSPAALQGRKSEARCVLSLLVSEQNPVSMKHKKKKKKPSESKACNVCACWRMATVCVRVHAPSRVFSYRTTAVSRWLTTELPVQHTSKISESEFQFPEPLRSSRPCQTHAEQQCSVEAGTTKMAAADSQDRNTAFAVCRSEWNSIPVLMFVRTGLPSRSGGVEPSHRASKSSRRSLPLLPVKAAAARRRPFSEHGFL